MKKTALILALLISASFLTAAPVNVNVDASTNVHPYQRDLAFGNNFMGEWCDYANYRANVYRFQQAGTRFVRFPGGSNSNEYHWNGDGSYDGDKVWHVNNSPNPTTFSRGFYELSAHRGSLSKGYGKWAVATDGDLSTYWLSYPDEPFTQWIYLDIETPSYAPVTVNKAVIDWGTPYATQFKVQYSNANWNGMGTWMYNDTAWTDTSAGIQTGSGGQSVINFSTLNVKYIRILMLGSSDAHNQYAIKEIRLYNGATQITANQPNVNQTASVSSSVALGDNFETNDTMDFEQFMSVCRSMTPTAIPLVTINYFTGTTQEAADWVYYANVYKNYGIQYWEIGNENAGTWEAGGPSLPEDYARRYIAFYDAMTAVDPSITVAPQFNSITDPCNVTMTAGNNAGASDYYIDTFLKYLADQGRNDIIKAISVHRYPTYQPATESVALATVDLWDTQLPQLKGWVNNRCLNPSGVKYWVTEFNDGIDSGFTNHFYDSLFVSSYLLNFLKNGGDQSCYFTAFGTPGPGQSDLTIFSDFGYLEGGSLNGPYMDKKWQPRASFYGLEVLYNDFSAADSFGNTIVAATSNNTSLKAYANLRGDRKLSLELINIDSANTMTANITVSGFTPLASADLASYSSQDYSWVLNGSQSYAAVDNPPSHSTLSVSGAFSYSVPPYSIRVITMYDAAQPTLVPSNTPTMLPTATPMPTVFPNGGSLIDDCEHAGNKNYWGGKWEPYGDTISTFSKVFDNMICDGLGAQGSSCHARVTGTVLDNTWGFGINVPLNNNWSPTDISMYDGIGFYYRGDTSGPARLDFVQSDMPGANYGLNINTTDTWQLYQVPFVSLTHSSWGPQTGTWTAKNVEAFQIQVNGGYSSTGGYRELDIDFVYFYKNTPTVTPTRTPNMSPTVTPTFTMTPTMTITPTLTPTQAPLIKADLDSMYVYPSSFNAGSGDKKVCFNNLTLKTRVQVYALSGEIVFNGKADEGGTLCWDLGGLRHNKRAASGIYVYVVTNEKGEKKQGKLTVIK